MWITPISFSAGNQAVQFAEGGEKLPLPPWSGVPVALEMEVDGEILARAVTLQEVGALYARDEEGEIVHCAAVVDAKGSHTCETDSVLMLVQCGPFEYDHHE
jgi:hypothetical protein